MRIHHLNCATLCPVSSRLVNGTGSLFSYGTMICHCVLIETDNSLILVDTGFGLNDIANSNNLSPIFRNFIRPKLSPDETAVVQIKQLGFNPSDVRHIILTHLDLDHAGGLPDFPNAEIHTSMTEYSTAMDAEKSLRNNFRYVPNHWSHNPIWKTHSVAGDKWFGFDAVTALNNKETDILLIPLRGHSNGHCGIAVKTEGKWILHCGDAYFYHDEMSSRNPHSSIALNIFQRMVESDHKARMNNQQRLRELRETQGNNIEMFCSHDHTEFEQCCGKAIENPSFD